MKRRKQIGQALLARKSVGRQGFPDLLEGVCPGPLLFILISHSQSKISCRNMVYCLGPQHVDCIAGLATQVQNPDSTSPTTRVCKQPATAVPHHPVDIATPDGHPLGDALGGNPVPVTTRVGCTAFPDIFLCHRYLLSNLTTYYAHFF